MKSEDYESNLLQRPDIRLHDAGDSTYLYRPGELVVDDAAVDRLGDLLSANDAKRVEDDDDDVTGELGMWRFRLDPGADIPGIVAKSQEIAPGAISPNHVVLGAPQRWGGPAGDASVTTPPELSPLEPSVGAGISIAVLDTGIWPKAPVTTAARATDAEILDSDQDTALDHEAGHGTFIAGLVSQLAPGADIQSIRVLDSMGVGDDIGIAAGLRRAHACEVVNLSLGGPSLGATGLPVLERAIEALDRSTVVVAAAGNAGRPVPFFPAAFKRVIAVGAIEQTRFGWSRAAFSNYGWWVDACAPGVDVRSIFPAFVEHAGKHRDFHRGWARWDGTSFAAPQVAASIAAVASRRGITAEEATWRLIHDPARPRLARQGLGTIVHPADLP